MTKIKEIDFDLILTDFKMAGKTGIDLIKEAKAIRPESSDRRDDSVRFYRKCNNRRKRRRLRLSSKTFYQRPVSAFSQKIQNLIDLRRENKSLKRPWVRRDFFAGLTSTASRSLEEFVKKMAPTDATILLTGESGTGKSELAKLFTNFRQGHQSPL